MLGEIRIKKTDLYNYHDYDSRKFIKSLINFLGECQVLRSLKKYEQSLKCSGVLYRDYYLKKRHPWLDALTQYYELVRNAKTIHKNLTPELQSLAIDAKKVYEVQRSMPGSIKNKYKRDLLDENRGYNYLFEIEIAWHYLLQDYTLHWYEDDSGKRPEFRVKAPNLSFNVECKWVSVDIARKIHRREFYLLAEKLIPEIEKRKYSGQLNISLEDRLTSETINELCPEILKQIDGGLLQGESKIESFGTLTLDLHSNSGAFIDFNEHMVDSYKRKADKAHLAVFAGAKDGKAVDPIELTVMSEKADTILNEIQKRISEAAKDQLDCSIPGLIVCFLEGVNGFELCELKSDSGLQRMTCHVLNKDKYSHIAGVNYSSERMVQKETGAEEIFNSALFFRNRKCKFKEATNFEFISRPRL